MTDKSEAQSGAGGTGFEPLLTFMRAALDVQEQAVSRAQSWSLNMMSAYREQAEEYNALLQAVNRSLRAMEDLVESQARTTRALSESLDASRQLVDSAVTTNQKSLERVESLVTGMVDHLGAQMKAQMEAVGDQSPLNDSTAAAPLAAQSAAYLQLTRDWMDAYAGMFGGAAAKRTAAEDEEEPGR